MKNEDEISKYYKKQYRIYNSTRPAFLFGRNQVVKKIYKNEASGNLLEIGCGTGYLLKKLCKLEGLKLSGIDVSQEMLSVAKKRLNDKVSLTATGLSSYIPKKKFDIVVLSYFLTIDLANSRSYIDKIKGLMKEGGRIYIVDFHQYGNWLYRKYMEWHGVEMSPVLIENLEKAFETESKQIKSAYLGLWKYFTFVGRNVK